MKFRPVLNDEKTILVISDLHLGAGVFIAGKRNPLEEFFFDQELIDFIHHYSSEKYIYRSVEIVINGDFLDFLAVPFIKFFDDEFWSEAAAVEKMKLIVKAHQGVFKALKSFVSVPNKKLTYIIGNHDAEMIFPQVQNIFYQEVGLEVKQNVKILSTEDLYNPIPGLYIKHGHQYEMAHQFSLNESIIQDANGLNYFLAPWGSYYVTRVINKYKSERDYVNVVRPIKTLLFFGMIFDTFFTLRFIFANISYFVMARFIEFYKLDKSLRKVSDKIIKELELFRNYDELTREFFEEHSDAKVLIVGHTHEANLTAYPDGTTFVNTGSWTKMMNLDFRRISYGANLTFAQIETRISEAEEESFQVNLNQWMGKNENPYRPYF